MTKEKWLLIALAVILVSVGIYHWVGTAPTWYLYHKEYPMVHSVDEFDTMMSQVREDVDQNFQYHYPIDSEIARDQIDSYLRDPGVVGCFVHAWAWVWEGSDMNPSWLVVRQWEDTWREFDYTSKKVQQAQFCMMGFTPTPIP
jgi:hypothetical protein